MRLVIALITSATLAGCLGSITDVGGGGGSGGGGGGGGQVGPDAKVVDVKAIFRTWSGCMTLANFQTAKMTTSWPQVLTNDGKQCINCHEQGQYNFLATDNEQAFFDGITQHSYFMAMYFMVDPATEKVVINTGSFKAANSSAGHPKFNADTNAGVTALTTFYIATAANTACDAPRMID